MRSPTESAILHLLVTLLLLAAYPLHAQTITGRLQEPGRGVPVQGALILLSNEGGLQSGGDLTDATGSFSIAVPGPGRYLISAERIGFETVHSGPIEINTGDTIHIELESPLSPIELSGIQVEGEQRCETRPEEGLAVQRVWEEARKALSLQNWTDREGRQEYGVVFVESKLDDQGGVRRTETRQGEGMYSEVPFKSLPVEALLRDGYIQRINRLQTEYYAPDASVILSDEFLDTHCFHLVRDPGKAEVIGVAFEPVNERPHVSGIRGVLWVNQRTSELQDLEFTYTQTPFARRRPLCGGSVDFGRLSSGGWVVRRWSILMPTPQGYRETGAEVRSVVPADQTPHPQRAEEIEEATEAVLKREVRYYRLRQDTWEWNDWRWEGECLADRGQSCFGGDPDRTGCPADVRCNPENEFDSLLDTLRAASKEHPEAPMVVGLAAYEHLKAGLFPDAFAIAESCQAEDWWCLLVKGMVFDGVGRVGEAEATYRQALEEAPDSIGCVLTDAAWVLPSSTRDILLQRECEQRVLLSDSIWWLADPLFSVPGNDRWTEHVSRGLKARFFRIPVRDRQNRGANTEQTEAWILEHRIPRGTPDSWREVRRFGVDGLYEVFTGESAARYHFVPDFKGEGVSEPVWRLDASLDDEGYTPPYGPFIDLPAQWARFRAGDSIQLAVSGSVSETLLEQALDPTGYLCLSDEPGKDLATLASAVSGGRLVFIATVPARDVVGSLEVVSDDGVGRHRTIVKTLSMDSPGLSDILLFRPRGTFLPDSLIHAAGMMLGTTRVRGSSEVGLYWQTYGVPEQATISIEIEVQREDSGILASIPGWLGRSGQEGSGRIQWEEPASGPVEPNAILLQLGALTDGKYLIRIKTSWEGGSPLIAERHLEIG